MPRADHQRSDARINRVRLLDAAEQYFSEHGADAPLRDLAARTGMGIGTLYRHFANRHALFEALMARFREAFDEQIHSTLGLESGWEKIVAFLDAGIVTTFRHPTLYLTVEWLRRNDPTFQPSSQWNEMVLAAVAQAHEEGSLRADVSATDIALIPHLLSSMAGFPEPMRSVAVGRQRAILLSGLQNGSSKPAPIPALALTSEQLIDLAGRAR